jgi:hypothetical protein
MFFPSADVLSREWRRSWKAVFLGPRLDGGARTLSGLDQIKVGVLALRIGFGWKNIIIRRADPERLHTAYPSTSPS